MNSSLRASSPENNVSVMASAGTGKTWLLVTRLLRLLLNGAAPSSILAITFTRKAAAEMQNRLRQRLQELAGLPRDALIETLDSLGIHSDEATLNQAEQLFETLLGSPWQVNTTTFHAFCQELLKRFPMEAEIPPGFDLIEKTGELEQRAWEALFNEAALHPDGELATTLERILQTAGSLFSTKGMLMEFLQLRSDWWAYSQGEPQPIEAALQKIHNDFQLDASIDSTLDDVKDELMEFAALLARHDTKTNLAFAVQIEKGFTDHAAGEGRFALISDAFLTKAFTPRARKSSKAQEKKMGPDGEQRMLQLHEKFCGHLTTIIQHKTAQQLYAINRDWFYAGNRLVEYYQSIKQEQRLLDFSDLEWLAYQLLTRSNNAHWIQYKLDQRIDHLLVDEFQDTNPTQWHLLLPLLQELAAQSDERLRSVFLVGDIKQSIYRFRRADPRLFIEADNYIRHSLAAEQFSLATSWRSSQAILDCVNRCFENDAAISNFESHSTHHQSLWGQVVLLPPAAADQPTAPPAWQGLRNPLHHPRDEGGTVSFYEEGLQIAEQIQRLITQPTMLGEGASAKRADYNDIMILVRNRTHVKYYEAALRDRHIPFIGADKATLLEAAEIEDMMSLLNTLSSPYNNLALASVLRSPLFGCSEEELMWLAKMDKDKGNWFQRLQLATEQQPNLARAAQLLSKWHSLVDRFPVHDLLDSIFKEGNVLARFASAYPEHLISRVSANLNRFLELALDIDSGRYPSLMQFIATIKAHRSFNESPDEAPDSSSSNKVRIMTIHASKGLEAPILFLADTIQTTKKDGGFVPLVNWPEGEARPDTLLIHQTKLPAPPDSIQQHLQHEASRQETEESNLFYVALTRARQLLFISGSKGNKNLGWYGRFLAAYQLNIDEIEAPVVLEERGTVASLVAPTTTTSSTATACSPDPRLRQPIKCESLFQEIAPSYQSGKQISSGDEDGTTRGIVIHLMLEQLCNTTTPDKEQIFAAVLKDVDPTLSEQWLSECWQEASAVMAHAEFKHLFADNDKVEASYNELPILYQQEGKTVYGFIDRLVVTKDEAWIVDYKSHQGVSLSTMAQYAEPYRQQLAMYADGVKRIWPDKKITGYLLFTHCAGLYEMK